ncbi:MAG TPA: G1 family glutamic endopeptidase [Mycobacteriales bacterium]|jgi:hypothetical protein|nr:G1 family glutamic endopeptidase [Mycobacteriales bacterium]
MNRNARAALVLSAAAVAATTLVASAAAATGSVSRSQTVQKSPSFAGYEVSKPTAHVNTATATFTVPTITCKKNFSGVGPSLVVQTTPNKHNIYTDEIAAVGVGCENKQPAYESIIQINGHSYNDLPFAANDKVKVTVTVRKQRTAVTVEDVTSDAHKTRTSSGRVGATAYIGDLGLIINSKKTGLDAFSKTSFTDVSVNTKSLAKEKAQAFDWTHGKTVKVAVSKLSKGKDFTLTFKHS